MKDFRFLILLAVLAAAVYSCCTIFPAAFDNAFQIPMEERHE
jgi:hypothetical protein